MPTPVQHAADCADCRDGRRHFDCMVVEAGVRASVEDECVDDFVTPDDWECDGTEDRDDSREINVGRGIPSPDLSEHGVSRDCVCVYAPSIPLKQAS